MWLLQGRPFDASTYTPFETPFVWDSPAALMFRTTAGDSDLLASVLIMVIAATALRRCEVWAWLVMWALPIHALMDLALVLGHGGDARRAFVWDIGSAGAIALALIPAPDRLQREVKGSSG